MTATVAIKSGGGAATKQQFGLFELQHGQKVAEGLTWDLQLCAKSAYGGTN